MIQSEDLISLREGCGNVLRSESVEAMLKGMVQLAVRHDSGASA